MDKRRRQARQRAFLAAFAKTGSIGLAAKAAKVHRSTHYDWLKEDEDYGAQFESAQDEAVDALEVEARRRAMKGTRRKRFNPKTGEAFFEFEYSDTLLIFLLKANAPAKYRDRVSLDANVQTNSKIVVELPAKEFLEDDQKPVIAADTIDGHAIAAASGAPG